MRRKSRKMSKKTCKRRKQKGGKKVVFTSEYFYDALNYIKEITIDSELPYELCGSISVGMTYKVITHETPPSAEARANCTYEDYNESIIWHNHPKTSKFYPSLEDIVKVFKMKNKKLHMSFIYTHVGYWRLEKIKNVEVTKELSSSINYWLDWLYFKTERGRTYNEEAVNHMTTNLNKLLETILHIEFNLY